MEKHVIWFQPSTWTTKQQDMTGSWSASPNRLKRCESTGVGTLLRSRGHWRFRIRLIGSTMVDLIILLASHHVISHRQSTTAFGLWHDELMTDYQGPKWSYFTYYNGKILQDMANVQSHPFRHVFLGSIGSKGRTLEHPSFSEAKPGWETPITCEDSSSGSCYFCHKTTGEAMCSTQCRMLRVSGLILILLRSNRSWYSWQKWGSTKKHTITGIHRDSQGSL